MEKKKWKLRNINPADTHTSTSDILMSHEQLPSCSIIPTFHCHYRSENFGCTQLNTNIYMDTFIKKSKSCDILKMAQNTFLGIK